jgi:asparagine synthase (glutamine-hydrolysing)
VVTARSDRYGCYPLFYAHRGNDLWLSTSILELVTRGAPMDLDAPAIAAFLRLGFYLGDDTPFSSIRILPPNAHLRWERGRLALSGGYSFRRADPQSRTAAVDGLITLFQRAIERRIPDVPAVLPLSGGRDSRHILLALQCCRHLPRECVTFRPFPPRSHLEVSAASAISSAVGVPHVVLEQESRRVDTECRKNLRTHFLSDEHAHFLVLFDYLDRLGAPSFDGLAGDMLTGQSSSLDAHILRLFLEERYADAATYAFDGYGKVGIEQALAGLLAPTVYRAFNRELAVERVAREMARHRAAANPVISFFFWNRTRRELALAPYALPRTTVYAPYLDHDVVDFLMSLPPGVVMDHRLHTEAITRAFPRHASIPFEENGPDRRAHSVVRYDAVDLGRLLLRRNAPLRRQHILPRLAAAATLGYAHHLWFLSLAVYLTQLLSDTAPAAMSALLEA